MKLPITLSPIDIFDADGITNEDDFVVQTAGGAFKIARYEEGEWTDNETDDEIDDVVAFGGPVVAYETPAEAENESAEETTF